MIRVFFRLTICLGFVFLLVINSLGSISDLLLQKHKRQIIGLRSLDISTLKEALVAEKRRLNLAASLAPWSAQPQEEKLAFSIYLAEIGIDMNLNWEEIDNVFLAATHRVPTKAEVYIDIVKLYQLAPQLFENTAKYNWAAMLTMAERLNPTNAYIHHIWGNLIYKKLPSTAPPLQDNVADICRHFGRWLTLQGPRLNWDLVNDAFGKCFGLTHNIELLAPLLNENSGLLRLWGYHLCSFKNRELREAVTNIEQRLSAKMNAAEACLALAQGLSSGCIAESARMIQNWIKRYPKFSNGWTWLIENLGNGTIVIEKDQLAELTQLALSHGTLNDKQIAGLSSLLCKRGMYALARPTLEVGLESTGRHDKVWEALVSCLVDSGQNGAATELLETALKRHPNMAWAWLALGRLQLDNGQFLSGEQSMNRVLKLEPGNSQAIYYLKKRGIY